MSDQVSAVSPAGRRRELDVLATFIVFGLGFFHSASIVSGQQLIVNTMQSETTLMLASLIVAFEWVWIMPVMMLIAGIAIWHSLGRRSPGAFVSERLLRLGVPFLTGLVLANPPQVYYYLKAREGLSTSFWRFYPSFWDLKFSLKSFPIFLEPAGGGETFSVIHLWFLIFLLVYTLLLLPFFLILRRPGGQRLASSVSGFFAKRFAIFLWALPIMLLEGFLGSFWPSGWNRWIWPLIILFGYLTAGDERLMAALVRHRILALVVGLVGYLIFFAGMGMAMSSGVDPWTGKGGIATVVRLIKGLTSWCLVIAVMGISIRLGQRAGARARSADKPSFWARLAAYGREAQLPYYVLHQTPIIILGYYVVQWNMPVLAKLALITLASLAATMLVYELLIRRIAVLRLLFGMRPKA